jgi:hypothetical protein
MVNVISVRVGIATILMGIMLGLVPGYTADLGEYGDGVSCGSPFFVSDDLTGSGLDACEGAGGLSTRRAWALALIVGGIVLVGAVAVNDIRSGGSPRFGTAPDNDNPPSLYS